MNEAEKTAALERRIADLERRLEATNAELMAVSMLTRPVFQHHPQQERVSMQVDRAVGLSQASPRLLEHQEFLALVRKHLERLMGPGDFPG